MIEFFNKPRVHKDLKLYLVAIDYEQQKVRFKTTADNNKMHTSKLYYNSGGLAYFNSDRKRYYISQFY